ncbi:hypothetical protein JCM10450v2_002828 [Rhodotorula kratochvilovae]
MPRRPLPLRSTLAALLGAVVFFILGATGAAAYPGPGAVSGDTEHDPSLAKGADGVYYLYGTTDRTTWRYVGDVFPSGAPSATDAYTGTHNGDLWAPDVTYTGGKFLMYYAASSMGSQKSGIFLAQSSSGKPGTWTDNGLVLSTKTGDAYNAIDPNLIIASSGQWYLTLGSFWTGMYAVELDPSTGKVKSGAKPVHLAQRSGVGAVEALWVYHHDNEFYYLFSSFDACCKGTSSTYNIRVSRSKHLLGPYIDKAGVAALSGGGTLVLALHDSIIGPGGQSILVDGDGPVLVYHYYTTVSSLLGINRLDFSSGWPVVV